MFRNWRLVVVFALMVSFSLGLAQERERFGVGFSSAIPRPLIGLTLQVDLTDALALEGIVGPLGSLSAYGLKASYSFVREPTYRIYGFGLGLLGSEEDYSGNSPTIFTFGGGAGLTFPYLALSGGDPSRLPLWATFDLGLVNRSLLDEGLSIYFGSGISFRF